MSSSAPAGAASRTRTGLAPSRRMPQTLEATRVCGLPAPAAAHRFQARSTGTTSWSSHSAKKLAANAPAAPCRRRR
eukprot:11051283-Lingulodinium_polyedra.AAC.1